MEEILTVIEKNTRPLPQIPFEISYKTTYHRENLPISIDLSDGNYVMGVTSLNTYNFIHNVTPENKTIVYLITIFMFYCLQHFY